MKNNAYKISAAIALLISATVNADNSVPPSGPYRSLNSAQPMGMAQNYDMNRNMPQPAAGEPEWVQQRKAEIEEMRQKEQKRQQEEWQKLQALQLEHQKKMAEQMNQRQAQMQQWMEENRANMPQPVMPGRDQLAYQKADPYKQPSFNARPPQNPPQQFFPNARGPIYGPNVAPPQYQQGPAYRGPQYQGGYPPMWR